MRVESLNYPNRVDPAKNEAPTHEVFSRAEIIPFFPSKRFYVAREGLVAIEDTGGKIIRVAKPGVPFGYENFEGALLFQGRVLTKKTLVEPIDINYEDNDSVMMVASLIARTTEYLEKRKRFTVQGFAPERVVQALLDTAINSNGELIVPLSQELIGEVAHVVREKVNRITSRLVARNIISKENQKITITNVAALKDIVK